MSPATNRQRVWKIIFGVLILHTFCKHHLKSLHGHCMQQYDQEMHKILALKPEIILIFFREATLEIIIQENYLSHFSDNR
jgi:hypothetical protein